jgi:hypothetical protein
VIPKTLDDRLISLLRSTGRWQDWPLDQILPSRASFFEFLLADIRKIAKNYLVMARAELTRAERERIRNQSRHAE